MQARLGTTFVAGLGCGWFASRGGVARAHAEGHCVEGGAREPSSAAAAAAVDDAFRPSTLSLRELRDIQRGFARERDWDQYHTPRNLALAMVGEVGELCECFQWKGEVQPGLPGFSDREKEHVGEEMSDVLLYLVRLADRCDVDLGAAVLRKVRLNGSKYPAALVHGSSKKYTEYAAAGVTTRGAASQEQGAGAAAARADGAAS